jgi:hypothetical protein
MVNRTAGLGGDSFASEGTRRYQQPLSRARSLVFLIGMLLTAAALTLGGIHVVNLTIVWQ